MSTKRFGSDARARNLAVLLLSGLGLAFIAVATTGSAVGATGGTGADAAGQRFVPNVVGAFSALSRRADALAVDPASTPEATLCKHYQGIARAAAPDGMPYLFLTKSGNQPFGICSGGTDPGVIVIARMGSRDPHGERFRTNILPYEGGLIDRPNLAVDRAVTHILLDGTADWPAYRHPGGMQLVGDVLAIGAEHPFKGGPNATILFADVSDPAAPEYLGRFDPPHQDPDDTEPDYCDTPDLLDIRGDCNSAFGADPVGVTLVRNADGTCCRYLLVVAGGPGNEQVRFYHSDPVTSPDDLRSPDFGWEEVGRFSEWAIEQCGTSWPTSDPSDLVVGGQHQMLNLVREGDVDGRLFLVGTRRDGVIALSNPEYVDLYEVHVGATGVPAACPLTHIQTKHTGTAAWGAFTRIEGFSAASSAYVSPSGELIVYTANHESTPAIVIGEFRHRDLVRGDSPTLLPTATVDGPVAVDEGSTVQLTGHGAQAISKAYIQLYEDPGAGSSLDGAVMNVDYADRDTAEFHDLADVRLGFDGTEPYTMAERASSWRWFAPAGCTISANDYPSHSDDWPGPDTVLLRGSGLYENAPSLASLQSYEPGDTFWRVAPVPDGETASSHFFDNDVEGVTFHHPVSANGNVRRHGCESYYGATIGLEWDLDGNGTWDVTGTSAVFDGAGADGPETRTAAARAKHPTDPTPLGVGAPLPVPVSVRNVPPAIGSASVADSLGHDLTVAAAAAIVGLPVSLAVTFTDPGVADTQTAHVAWGDGTSTTTFGTFTDAHGGATGQLRHTHVFATTGSRTITTTVTDDDGGATPVSLTIQVLSLADAIESVADRITQRIAAAPTAPYASALRAARDELIGNHGGKPPTNGAVDKLAANDPVSAITKLKAAIAQLATAEARGAGNLSALKDVLGLVAEGIATSTYERAKAVAGSKQAKTLATIAALLTTGHQQLAARQYATACDMFRQATDKALALLR